MNKDNKIKLENRMKSTSTLLKDYEKILNIKHSIKIWTEYILIIISVCIGFLDYNSNMITIGLPIVITITVLYLGKENYELMKHINRSTYLGIDELFVKLRTEDLTIVEEEYQRNIRRGINIPSFVNNIKVNRNNIASSRKKRADESFKWTCSEVIDICIQIVRYVKNFFLKWFHILYETFIISIIIYCVIAIL